MPKILDERRKAIARNNPKLSESSTWAIATSALQKEGKLPRKKKFAEGGKVDDDGDGDPVQRQLSPPSIAPHLDPTMHKQFPQRTGVYAPFTRSNQAQMSEMSRAAQQADLEERRATSRIQKHGSNTTAPEFAKGGKVLKTWRG